MTSSVRQHCHAYVIWVAEHWGERDLDLTRLYILARSEILTC